MKRFLGRPKVSNFIARLAGERRVLRRFEDFRNREPVIAVHFVCHGNICRSPFAEYKVRQSWTLPASSSGLHGAVGRGADSAAIRIAAERGVDLSSHRVSAFDSKMLAPGTLVVVMETAHLFEIEERAPEISQQVVILGAFGLAKGLDLTIADPWGKDDGTFRHCFEQIEVSLEALGNALKQ